MNTSQLHRRRDLTLLHVGLIILVLSVRGFARPQDGDYERPAAVSELCWAGLRGDYGSARKLVGKGEDVNGLSENGETPILCALQDWIALPRESRIISDRGKRKMQIVRLLLDHGADPQHMNELGMTAILQLAASHFSEEQTLRAFGWLVENGARVQVANKNGLTPLMYCAMRNDTGLARLLLKQGVDPNATDQRGRTALSIAKEHGNKSVIALLSEATGKGQSK